MDDNFYDIVAGHYDVLQEDIVPEKWAQKIDVLAEKYGKTSGKKLLDLGCGDGRIDEALFGLGYKITGLDTSRSMLSLAEGRLPSEIWLEKDITDFDLGNDFDVCVSLLDTVNHILEPEAVAGMISCAAESLKDGGLFIFDMATYKHFSETLSDNVFYSDYEDFTLLWVNEFDDDEMMNYADLTLFEREEDGRYSKYDGCIEERFYDREFLMDAASEFGLELCREQPSDDGERLFLIFKKVNK